MTSTTLSDSTPQADDYPADSERAAEIYRAAAKIFQSRGYHATSINEIADAVHLTKAGLYYYIKGKQDLLFGIMNYAMDLLEDYVVEPARSIESPEERLRVVIKTHARLIVRDSSALTILVNELQGLTVSQREEITQRQRAYMLFLRQTLETLRDLGKLRDVHPTVAAFGLLGMILWISRWFRADGELSREEVAEAITEMGLASVLRP